MPSYVIAGASLAGAKAAETLRDEGFDGDIVLIGAEHERPYERPPLSKGYLLGSDQRDSVYVHPVGWYEPKTCGPARGDHRSPRSTRSARTVATTGQAGELDVLTTSCCCATGASPRRLNFPGSDREEVLYLRTVGDSDRLRSAFQPGTRVVVAGAGWIGLETTAAARSAECAVTVLEPQAGALTDQLGPELGAVFADLHRAHGVEFRFGEKAVEFRPGVVITSGGAEIPADLLVVGIGAAPNEDLAARAWAGDRQRRTDRRGAAHLGPGHLRRRRRRELLPSPARPACPRRALGQRAERRSGRRPVHAGPGRELRPGALLL
jgi:3-phenylpropionate/trans-cinnamate dioxygenase ferredoxin reductase subunit